MRQAGVLAAAGLVALSDGPDGMIERLAEDHANARRLAEALAGMDGIVSAGGTAQPAPGPLDPAACAPTSSCSRSERDRAAFLAALRARDVEMVEYPHGQVRAVTHYGVTPATSRPSSPRPERRSPRRRVRERRSPRPPDRGHQRARPVARPPAAPTSRVVRRFLPRDRSTPSPAAAAPRAGGRRPARSTTRCTTSSRPASCGSSATTRSSATCGRPAPGRRPARRRQPRGGPRRARRRARRTWPRSRRSTRPALSRRGRASSATSSSTTSGARSSTPTSCASGSAARSALDHVGDGLFLLFARDHAPLAERLEAIAGRLEARRDLPRGGQDPGDASRRSGAGSSSSSRPAAELPAFFDETRRRPAPASCRPRSSAASSAPSETAKIAVELYARLARGHARRTGPTTGRSGASAHDALVGLRAFDGLDADAILELGWERLARGAAPPGPRPPARSTRTRDETDGHRPRQVGPAGRRSRPPSTPTATRCCARAST